MQPPTVRTVNYFLTSAVQSLEFLFSAQSELNLKYIYILKIISSEV